MRPGEKSAGREHDGARGELEPDLRHDARRRGRRRAADRPPPAEKSAGWAGSPAGRGSRCRYSTRSACARVARTAGPLRELRMRNWIPASSVAAAIAPPSASISLTRWPLPMPPIEGLHDICPSVSMLWVRSKRAAAQPGAGERGLGAGVAATDNNYIKYINHLHNLLRLLMRAMIRRKPRYILTQCST